MNAGNRGNLWFYIAANTTAVGGKLHLVVVPNITGRNPNSGIFFTISGIAQIFWVIPCLRDGKELGTIQE
jgi:hypothetical protein